MQVDLEAPLNAGSEASGKDFQALEAFPKLPAPTSRLRVVSWVLSLALETCHGLETEHYTIHLASG